MDAVPAVVGVEPRGLYDFCVATRARMEKKKVFSEVINIQKRRAVRSLVSIGVGMATETPLWPHASNTDTVNICRELYNLIYILVTVGYVDLKRQRRGR